MDRRHLAGTGVNTIPSLRENYYALAGRMPAVHKGYITAKQLLEIKIKQEPLRSRAWHAMPLRVMSWHL